MGAPAKFSGRITRRQAVGAAAGAAAFVPVRRLLAQTEKAAARKPRFFTAVELALLDELAEIIIPADEHSPGARATEVAWDIDARLGELLPRIPEHRAIRARWKAGLKRLEQLSREMHGAAVLASTPEQRIAVMERIAVNEAKPVKAEERFFVELKALVASSYYTSEIGIHKDIGYKGNGYFEEFVGHEVKPAR